MKTIAQITLTSLMIILLSNISLAGSLTKFKMYLNGDNAIEVLSKVETLVDECLPVVNTDFYKKSVPTTASFTVKSKEELPLEEDLNLPEVSEEKLSVADMSALIKSLTKPEEEIDDLNFDTHEVFEQIQASEQFNLTPEKLSDFIKDEKEVMEDVYYSSAVPPLTK